MGKQDGLAVCVNFYTPDISAFTETRLNSGIINYHIIHNSTSYKGEGGGNSLRKGVLHYVR